MQPTNHAPEAPQARPRDDMQQAAIAIATLATIAAEMLNEIHDSRIWTVLTKPANTRPN